MSLKEYKSKRNFKNTNEPNGNLNKTQANRFVIQYHKARADHYDFRLEHNGVLLSWAVPKGLSQNPKDNRLAVMVEDHPVDYINFEGIIPKGNYGAGTVEIFDKGNYLEIKDFKTGLKKGHLKFVLNGEKLKGCWSLIRIKENNWLIKKISDEYAVKAIKNERIKLPFNKCEIQLATLSKNIPKGKNWIFEIKYDGYRIISYVEKNKVKMLTRNGIDYTAKFKDIAKSLQGLNEDIFVVDGEVVVFGEHGRSDFSLLQNSIKNKKNDIFYVIFDILALKNVDLRNFPLKNRKEKLQRLLFDCNKNLIYSNDVDDGKASFDFAKSNNLEGIMAKNSMSTYTGGRTSDWLKIKCYQRQEFVIAGFTNSEKNELISALILGYYKNEDLIFVGKVGTGFNEQTKKDLHKLFVKNKQKNCPFKKEIKLKNATWIKPKFVAEIQYAELTNDKILRQPSFIGLREDKQPKDVKLEVDNEN